MTATGATHSGLAPVYEQLAELVESSRGAVVLGMSCLPAIQVDQAVKELRDLADRHKAGRVSPGENCSPDGD